MSNMKQSDIPERIEGVDAENVSVLALCKRHKRKLRKGQRNCDQCNRDANSQYKARLKREAEMFRKMALIARTG